MMAYLQDGQFHIQIKGHQPVVSISRMGVMNDGKWREVKHQEGILIFRCLIFTVSQVKLLKQLDQLVIQIDNEEPTVHSVPKKLRLRPLFVGGIPKKLSKPVWVRYK